MSPISVSDFREICRLRVLRESEAISDSMTYGDDVWEANVLAAFHRLSTVEKKLGSGPVALNDDWSVRHKAFHFALSSACPSPLLLGMIDSLFDRAERYRRFSALHRQVVRHKTNEHQALMKAALSRDNEKAISLSRKHIESTQDRISEAIERQLATIQ